MISAVVLAKNEQQKLQRCLRSLVWADEIIVVDDNSDDRTVEIARRLGGRVITHPLHGNFGQQRNFGLKKARGGWILFVDADEVVPPALAEEIQTAVSSSKSSDKKGFYFYRRDFVWGGELRYGEQGTVKLVRLARKDTGRWKGRVHEYWDIDGPIGIFTTPLLHYPHQTMSEFLEHINFYSTLHAQQKYADGQNSSLVKILVWPPAKFVNNWLVKGGFLDAGPGFIAVGMMSFHSFLAWSKLWLLPK